MNNKKGVGVPADYKSEAHNKFDVLWKVKIKGRKILADDIPLHVSLRVFDDLDKKGMDEVKAKVKEFCIHTPDPKKLKFKTIIFHSKFNHRDYYMLKIDGMDDSCDKFFNHFKKGYGFSHPKFMAHATIDKDLYDKINKEGLKPEEVEFDDLTIEGGAGNTIHDFEQLEKSYKDDTAAKDNKMQLTPNEVDIIEDAGILDGSPVKLLRTKGGFWMAIGRPRGKYREEALAAGSHPAIVKYNLERQFPTFQPAMMKSELLSNNVKVEKHSHFLSEPLLKSGHDIYSVQSGDKIEFQVTKQNAKLYSVDASIKDGALTFDEMKIGKEFTRALAGAASEKALQCKVNIRLQSK